MGWFLIGLGALVGLAWLWLAWRALFADRARQRLRCPKCFYVLRDPGSDASVPDACPECGTGCTNPARLTCTHRYWGRLGWTTLLAVVLGGGLVLGGRGLQHGWGALPDDVAARLVSLDLGTLNGHVQDRIRRGYFDAGETRPVVRTALEMVASGLPDRVDKGLTLLEAVYRNAYALGGDRVDAERPRLIDLDPKHTASTLIEVYTSLPESDQARVLRILSQVRRTDDRANTILFRASASDSAPLQESALFGLDAQWQRRAGERRAPSLQHMLPTVGQGGNTDHPAVHRAFVTALLETVEEDRFTQESVDFGLDVLQRGRVAIVERLPESAPDADREIVTPNLPRGYRDEPERAARAVGLWLAATTEGPTERCFEWIQRWANDDIYEIRAMAIECCLLFDFSPRVEAVLSAAMADQRDSFRATNDATAVSGEFGPAASALVDDFLSFAARTDRGGWSSGIPEDFIAIGGNPREMIQALLTRIENYLELEAEGKGSKTHYMSDGHPLTTDFEAIAELGEGMKDAADVLMPYIDSDRVQISVPAAYAHSFMAGASELTTRSVLRFEPDLSQPLYSYARQRFFANMIMGGVALPAPVVEYALDPNSPERIDAFINFFSEFSSYMQEWAPYGPILRAGLESNDPATVDAAQTLIDKHLSEPED